MRRNVFLRVCLKLLKAWLRTEVKSPVVMRRVMRRRGGIDRHAADRIDGRTALAGTMSRVVKFSHGRPPGR
jgi:hypothetical protein